ncbi:MAG: hypothetical protein NTW05_16175 [Pseudonocardiales bacterium]|nr:hypothetical protein [Pseudonocardiales bacterium]
MDIFTHDLPNAAHPAWCATPCCDLSISTDPIHRMWPQAWTLATSGVQVAIAAQREDELHSNGTSATTRSAVGLDLLDEECLTPHGDPVRVRTSIPPDEARRLADALYAQADLADAIARGEAR